MRTVSFQGTQLSASERRSLELRRQVQASFLNPALQVQVDQTFEYLDKRKEQGAKPEKIWVLDYSTKGTPFLGDVFGY
ncbi:hypothetical protein ACVTMO_12205 [Pseudomonas segetis]